MVRFIGGFPTNPVQPGLLGDNLIYRPEYGGTGLLNDGADFQGVRQDFAGGMLDGFQINPVTGMPQTVSPSGVFRPTGGDPSITPPQEEAGGDGAFSITDLMELQSSLNQANFGNQDVASVFGSFVDAGKGTFNIDPQGGGSYVVASSLFGTDANGNRVPMDKAEYKYGDRKGTPISKQYAMNVMKAALSGIDESGGGDGSQGDSEGDSAQ